MNRDSVHHIQSNGISLLTENIITAEKVLHPNTEKLRIDVKSKQPRYHRPSSKNNSNDRKHERLDRRKRSDHRQQNQKRFDHQQPEFKGR